MPFSPFLLSTLVISVIKALELLIWWPLSQSKKIFCSYEVIGMISTFYIFWTWKAFFFKQIPKFSYNIVQLQDTG